MLGELSGLCLPVESDKPGITEAIHQSLDSMGQNVEMNRNAITAKPDPTSFRTQQAAGSSTTRGAVGEGVVTKELRIMVLASMPMEIVGVDLETGALVRALSFPHNDLSASAGMDTPADTGIPDTPPVAGQDSASNEEEAGDTREQVNGFDTTGVSTFDVVVVRAAQADERLDPAQPEAVAIASSPQLAQHLRPRQIRQCLTRLVAPERGPLLGFRGPSTPYWSLTGSHPSVALVELRRGIQLFRRPGENYPRVRFQWGRSEERLPLLDARLAGLIEAHERSTPGRILIEEALGFHPAFLVASLTPPEGGHSYKVALTLLPRA